MNYGNIFSLCWIFTNCVCVVLQPLNVRAKLKIAKPAQEQDFEQPVLDAQFYFDEICLNINKNQVWIIVIIIFIYFNIILVFGFTWFTWISRLS